MYCLSANICFLIARRGKECAPHCICVQIRLGEQKSNPISIRSVVIAHQFKKKQKVFFSEHISGEANIARRYRHKERRIWPVFVHYTLTTVSLSFLTASRSVSGNTASPRPVTR